MEHARLALAGLRLAALVAVAAAWGLPATAGLDKVHPRVLAEAESSGAAEFVVFLDEQAEFGPWLDGRTKAERTREVFDTLTALAARSQAPLIAWLEARAIPHHSLWIANMIWARAELGVIADLAARADVRRIDANPRVRVHVVPTDAAQEGGRAPLAIEWGLLRVHADDVWALGYDGSGVVVGGQDTGYQWTHPALVAQYRGWNGAAADHDYNWHDAIHSGGGSCGADAAAPCDDHGHGTHTMGTVVGDDGGANRIGMAPGARWIACRNMDEGVGTPLTYSECFQFFVAPTDLDGLHPDPQRAPDVINNSWTCPPEEGCSAGALATVVRNTRRAGIVVVAAAGNAGDACSSIDVPPAIYADTFTIAATDSADVVASFSSRGPVTVDGSNRLKPDVSAPGVEVRSSVLGGGYGLASGTSMASPHAAGLVALLLDARPDLRGRVPEVETLIRLSATPRTSAQQCGGIPGSEVPNPIYGHGRIDALETITGDADGDGLDNLDDCAPVDEDVWTPPPPVADLTLGKDDAGIVLAWSAPPDPGSGPLRYDVLKSPVADDFSAPTCLAAEALPTTFHDTAESGATAYYLVRATNVCGASVGPASNGTPRVVGGCPGSEFPLGIFSGPRIPRPQD